MNPLRFIDLFCGCGGFTLGMLRAGFECLAAIDTNPEAIATLRANLVEKPHPGFVPVTQGLERDLTRFGPEELAALLESSGPRRAAVLPRPSGWGEGRGEGPMGMVDVIVGGPPCQGFSKVRRVDGTNNGPRLVHDPRRHLYRDFLRYVDFFQPRLFVMENVLGLRSASGGEYFTAVQKEARELGRAAGKPGYRVHGQIEDAWELGVPQKRRRQLIIGVRNDLPGYFLPDLEPAPRAKPNSLLWDAIGDLPILHPGGGQDEREYDLARRCDHVQRQGARALRYLCKVIEIDRARTLTNHTARPHSDRDLRDFDRLGEGESSAAAMRRGVEFEFPYTKRHFKDRYTRQSRWEPCSTIVAHMSKDGLMFIHPTQCRSLTPREAARVQTFPDWFRFPASRTQAYRLIGNAVPPLVAEAVGFAVQKFLGGAHASGVPFAASRREPDPTLEAVRRDAERSTRDARAPQTRHAAARALERLANLDRRALRALPTDEFLRGWHALLFLFPGLHPDNALDHGDTVEDIPTEQLGLPGFEQLLTRRHARSGWPVALELIASEAWRRYEGGDLADDQFYCVAVQRSGLRQQATRDNMRRLGRPATAWSREKRPTRLARADPPMTTEPDRLLRRLGNSIRSKRTDLNLTQAALARKARISVAQLSRVELGNGEVSLLCLVRIARILRTTVQSLCVDTEERTRQVRRHSAK